MVAVEGREERTSSNSNSNSANLNSDNPKEVSASGRSSGGGYSFLNDAEAREVIAVVQALLAPGGGVASAADIGIVTPYNGQVSSQRVVDGRMGACVSVGGWVGGLMVPVAREAVESWRQQHHVLQRAGALCTVSFR